MRLVLCNAHKPLKIATWTIDKQIYIRKNARYFMAREVSFNIYPDQKASFLIDLPNQPSTNSSNASGSFKTLPGSSRLHEVEDALA
jgi:hypothetical protein